MVNGTKIATLEVVSPRWISIWLYPQRQRGHEALLLLKVQPRELAVVLLGRWSRLKDVVAEALPVVRHVHHKEGQKEHTLVAALQLLQELFRLRAVGGKVGGE